VPALVEPESGLTDGGNLDRIGIVVLGALGLQATYTGPLDEDARILRGLERVALDANRAQRRGDRAGRRRDRTRRQRPDQKSAGVSSIGVPCGVRAAACAQAWR
jgi:hypothetical protein